MQIIICNGNLGRRPSVTVATALGTSLQCAQAVHNALRSSMQTQGRLQLPGRLLRPKIGRIAHRTQKTEDQEWRTAEGGRVIIKGTGLGPGGPWVGLASRHCGFSVKCANGTFDASVRFSGFCWFEWCLFVFGWFVLVCCACWWSPCCCCGRLWCDCMFCRPDVSAAPAKRPIAFCTCKCQCANLQMAMLLLAPSVLDCSSILALVLCMQYHVMHFQAYAVILYSACPS